MEVYDSKYYGFYFLNFKNKRMLATKNLVPGLKNFNERIYAIDNVEYREINPSHSKLAAAIIKKISFIPIKNGDKILYLGASHGYTPSYLSDVIGIEGILFCIDFAPRVVRDLLFVCEERKNMIPILASANHPEEYKKRIIQVDVIYQDIAQKNQVEILFKNLEFLKPKGHVLIAIKARSIDVTRSPLRIYHEVESELKERLRIIDKKELDPFQKDHCLFICQKK